MNKNLGLAYVAKKVVLGTDFVIERLRKKQVYLILLATDASDPTKKKINDKAKTYQTTVVEKYTTDELSQAIGKKNIKVIGVIDKGFAALLM